MAATHGNNPEAWKNFLNTLDARLQFGLLSRIQKASAYHFEDKNLFIEFTNQTDLDYLNKEAVRQQLQILAQDILGVKEVVVRKMT